MKIYLECLALWVVFLGVASALAIACYKYPIIILVAIGAVLIFVPPIFGARLEMEGKQVSETRHEGGKNEM